ncbi:hypothetical protein RQN30_07545 [Arcanobacterium hippocoleae]
MSITALSCRRITLTFHYHTPTIDKYLRLYISFTASLPVVPVKTRDETQTIYPPHIASTVADAALITVCIRSYRSTSRQSCAFPLFSLTGEAAATSFPYTRIRPFVEAS